MASTAMGMARDARIPDLTGSAGRTKVRHTCSGRWCQPNRGLEENQVQVVLDVAGEGACEPDCLEAHHLQVLCAPDELSAATKRRTSSACRIEVHLSFPDTDSMRYSQPAIGALSPAMRYSQPAIGAPSASDSAIVGESPLWLHFGCT
jgi:hypothetical protein